MTSILRRIVRRRMTKQIEICPDLWDLDKQLSVCEKWLKANWKKSTKGTWVLDIGFQKRAVGVPGYTVSVNFMRLLCAHDITLWLSLYPPEAEMAVTIAKGTGMPVERVIGLLTKGQITSES